MERLTVVERDRQQELEAAIAQQDEKQRAAQFSIIQGGTLLKKDIGKARIEFGSWGAGPWLTFLFISW
jgi:hypothetical protein